MENKAVHPWWRIATLVGLLVLFSVAMTMRLYVLLADTTPAGDAASRYYPLAYNLWMGNGFSARLQPPYTPSGFDVPGYPGFVAAIFWATEGDKQAVILVQLMLELSTLLLLGHLARQMRLPRHIQIMAIVFGLLCPFLPMWCARMMTEIVATLLATFICYCLIRAIDRKTRRKLLWWCMAGLGIGICVSVRPDMVLASGFMMLTAALLAWHGSWRRWLRTAGRLAACVMVIALALTPWTIRSYNLFGKFQPLGRIGDQRTNGYAVWLGTWADNTSYSKPFWWDILKPHGPASFTSYKLFEDEKREANAALEIARRQQNFDGEPSERFMALANEAKRRRPLEAYLMNPWRRVKNTWLNMPNYTPLATLPGFASRPDGSSTPEQHKAMGVLQSLWVPLVVFFLIGSCWSVAHVHKGVGIMFALILGRSALPFISGLAVEPRYIIEALPICFILAAVGVEAVGVGILAALTRLPLIGKQVQAWAYPPVPAYPSGASPGAVPLRARPVSPARATYALLRRSQHGPKPATIRQGLRRIRVLRPRVGETAYNATTAPANGTGEVSVRENGSALNGAQKKRVSQGANANTSASQQYRWLRARHTPATTPEAVETGAQATIAASQDSPRQQDATIPSPSIKSAQKTRVRHNRKRSHSGSSRRTRLKNR